MAKSLIIQDLISNKASLSQALERILIISLELGDQKVQDWVKNEVNGYKTKNLPEYRYTELIPIGSYQLYSLGSLLRYSNQILPTMGVPEDLKKDMNHHGLTQGIPELLDQKAQIEKGGTVGIPVSPEMFSMFQKGTNAEVTSAILSLSSYAIGGIIEEVRIRAIELLTLYEKNFGNLDQFDISQNEYSDSDIGKLKDAADTIIKGGSIGNTVIVNSKIKGSNIGKNNSSSKEIKTEVNPNVNLAPKESLFSKMLHIFKKR